MSLRFPPIGFILLGFTISAASVAEKPADSAAVRRDKPGGSQRVTFSTDDNLVLVGSYTPPKPGANKNAKAPVAILLHMYSSNRSAYDPLVPHLNDAGFAVLAVDFRGHGESLGPPELHLSERVAQREKKLFTLMQKDVDAAYRWLAQQPNLDLSRLAIVGASIGCTIALKYAVHDKSVDAVVCLSPGTAYLGLDSREDVKNYGERSLLLIATEPERRETDELSQINTHATVKIYPGHAGAPQSLHGTLMLGQITGIEKLIVDFLVKSVGPPSKDIVVASIKGQVYHPLDSKNAALVNQGNLRYFTSPQEAQDRGLRAPKSGSKSAMP